MSSPVRQKPGPTRESDADPDAPSRRRRKAFAALGLALLAWLFFVLAAIGLSRLFA